MSISRLSPLRRAMLTLAIASLLPAARLWAQDEFPVSMAESSTPSGASAGASPSDNSSSSGDATSQGNTNSTDNSTSSGGATSTDNTASPAGANAPYESPGSETAQPGIEGFPANRTVPVGAFPQDPTGLPYSSVLNPDTAGPVDVNALNGGPVHTNVLAPAQIGGAEGSLDIRSGNFSTNTPFLRAGGEPEDADIKAGPLFIKFHYLDGLLLYDDNSRRSHNQRSSEVLVLLRLNLSIIAQLSDNLQFTISGSFEYLPIQNQFGVATNAFSSLGLFLYAAPLLVSQLAYDTVIAGWPVRFTDDFQVGTGAYSDSARDNFQLFQGDYLSRNEQNGYFFRSGQQTPGSNGSSSQNSNIDDGIVYFSNTVSAETDRLLPTDMRLTLRVDHENLWYNQSNSGLPPGRDDFIASLVSERDNLRFKPYASYEASYVEGSPDVTQIVQVGIFGPIDDQIFLRAAAGYYFNANGHDGELYWLSLEHTAGDYTTESLGAERTLSLFNDQVLTSYYYLLRQILGPTLNANLFADYVSSDDLINGGRSSFSGELGGLQLIWALGPKTQLSLAGIAEHQNYDEGTRKDTVTGRVILNREVTDTLTFQLLYQYQRSSSNLSGFSYYENLVYFRIVKFFE